MIASRHRRLESASARFTHLQVLATRRAESLCCYVKVVNADALLDSYSHGVAGLSICGQSQIDIATPGQRRRQSHIALIQADKPALRSGKPFITRLQHIHYFILNPISEIVSKLSRHRLCGIHGCEITVFQYLNFQNKY